MPEPYKLVAAVAFGLVKAPISSGPDPTLGLKQLRAELRERGLYLIFDTGERNRMVPHGPAGWRLHTGYSNKKKSFTVAFGSLPHVCRAALQRANPERLPTHEEVLEP